MGKFTAAIGLALNYSALGTNLIFIPCLVVSGQLRILVFISLMILSTGPLTQYTWTPVELSSKTLVYHMSV